MLKIFEKILSFFIYLCMIVLDGFFEFLSCQSIAKFNFAGAPFLSMGGFSMWPSSEFQILYNQAL